MNNCDEILIDYYINIPGGSLSVDNLPSAYTPDGVNYVTVTIKSERLENRGFQMTARFEDGTQAGSFEWKVNRLKFTLRISDDVQYLQYTLEGTRPTDHREVSWNFKWKAPESPDGK